MHGYSFALAQDVHNGLLDPRAVTAHIREISDLVKIAGPRQDKRRNAWEVAQIGNVLHRLPPETQKGWDFIEPLYDEAHLFELSLLALPQFRRPKPAWWEEAETRPMREHLPVACNAHALEVFSERLRLAQVEWDNAHPGLPRYETSKEFLDVKYPRAGAAEGAMPSAEPLTSPET